MNENFKKLLEEMSKNEEHAKKIAEINKMYPELEDNAKAIAELAKTIGIDISAEDLLNAAKEAESSKLSEMSDDELDAVNGGCTVAYEIFDENRTYLGVNYVCECYCSLGGSGYANTRQNRCSCIFSGEGYFTNENPSAIRGKKALDCVLVGEGVQYFLKHED